MLAGLLRTELGQLRDLLAGLRGLVPLRNTGFEVLHPTVETVALHQLAVPPVTRLEDGARLVAVAGCGRSVTLHRVARVHTVLLDDGELVIGVCVPAEDLASQLETVLVGAVVELCHLGGDVGGLGVLDTGLVGLGHEERAVTRETLRGVPRNLTRVLAHARTEGTRRLLATAGAVELGSRQVHGECGVEAVLGDRGDPLEVDDHQPSPFLELGGDLLLLGQRGLDGRGSTW